MYVPQVSHVTGLIITLLFILAAGEDFQRFENVELTFTSGVTRLCAKIIPINDNVTEGQEMFQVELSSPDPDTDTGPPSTVVLVDGDGKQLATSHTYFTHYPLFLYHFLHILFHQLW